MPRWAVMVPDLAGSVRSRIGAAIFERVAGPEGPARRQVINAAGGERWFADGRPIRRVHGDASMFIGGLSALLLQSLHPLAMAAVAAHSGYRGDPWGRLQRTSTFLATTTYGTAEHAEQICERVRSVHGRIHGFTAEGEEYHAAAAWLGARGRGRQFSARTSALRNESPLRGRL